MMFPIPPVLSLEARIALEHDMMYHDPDHFKNTEREIGHPPTETDLAIQWFGKGGTTGFHHTLADIAEQRVAA